MDYKKIFNLYVLKNAIMHPNREWMLKPTINTLDGKVWATDGAAAIIIPISLAGNNYYSSEEIKVSWPAVSKSQKVLTIKQIEDAVAKCGVEVKCPECGGKGIVTWEYKATTDSIIFKQNDRCPVCEGYGCIFKEKPTGRFKPSHRCAISIGEGLYSAWQIDRIAKAMRIIGADTITVMSKSTKTGALLLCTGDVEILQMPVYEPVKVGASL